MFYKFFIYVRYIRVWASLMAQMVKNEGDLGSVSGLQRSPGGGHGKPTPIFLPGESPWTEEPGGL